MRKKPDLPHGWSETWSYHGRYFHLVASWDRDGSRILGNPVVSVVVAEGMGGLPSFKRSPDLVSGSWWSYAWCYVYCTCVVCVALTLVVQMAVVTIFGTSDSGALFSIKYSTVNEVPSIALKPVIYIMMTVMYLDLRIEKEGLNFDILVPPMLLPTVP